MTALILPKLGMCRDKSEAIDELRRMGASPLGEGCFATVFRVEVMDKGTPNFQDFRMIANLDPWAMIQPVKSVVVATRAIKVCRRDPGGLIAAKAAMLTHEYDDLAPRYYGITEWGDGGWMGEMEVLSAVNVYSNHYATAGHSEATMCITHGKREPHPTIRASSVYVRTLYEMMAAYTDKTGKTGSWDLHGENVMMRGTQPVITDPFCF